MFYSFDINKWIAELIPRIMRRKLLYALLKALVFPIYYLYERFQSYRKEIENRLSHNAFTIYLEKFLNDMFDADGIYIVDNIIEQTLYLAFRHEDTPLDYKAIRSEGTSPVYVSNADRLIGGFTVMVPRKIASKDNIGTISRWVEYYKYAGTQFKIVIY